MNIFLVITSDSLVSEIIRDKLISRFGVSVEIIRIGGKYSIWIEPEEYLNRDLMRGYAMGIKDCNEIENE